MPHFFSSIESVCDTIGFTFIFVIGLLVVLLRGCQLPVGLHHGLDGEQLTADVQQNVVHVLHLVLETLEIRHFHLVSNMTIEHTEKYKKRP